MKNREQKEKSKSEPRFYIDENHCFCGVDFTVSEMHDAMEAYQRKKKSHSDWLYNDTIPIFVDANILLNVYFSPVPQREHLSRFLSNNKDRLYITCQVEKEFMRHRLQFIDKYKNTLTEAANRFRQKCSKFNIDFTCLFSELKNASVNQNFIDSLSQTDALIAEAEVMADNAQLLNETYQSFINKLNLIKEKFEEEYKILYEAVNIEYNDPILKAISNLKVLKPLSQKEYEFTKSLYEKLQERFNVEKDSSAPYYRFPGSGEKKDSELKKEPWGDLVIYHQLLVFMAESHKDVIFITNDKSKLDWMKKGGEPYSYYIADAYKNTHQTLFIISDDDFHLQNYTSVNDSLMDEDSIGFPNSTLYKGTSGGEDPYKNITSEQFLSELERYSQWTEKYGGKYVSQSYFIYVVLGQQGYRFSKSIDVLNELKDEKVEIYEQNKKGNKIPCIRLKK